MIQENNYLQFGNLFRKYRLRSEINSLRQFGDLLAQEGIVYETSIFTRWQRGNRKPKYREIMLFILKIFIKRKGIKKCAEANNFFEAAGHGYLTNHEKQILCLK